MDDIYEVERDDYAGVISQINPKTTKSYTYKTEEGTVVEIKTLRGTLLTRRIIPEEAEERYYVFELPKGPNCLPPKPVRKITLETKEEVQAFFDALSKIQKGEIK